MKMDFREMLGWIPVRTFSWMVVVCINVLVLPVAAQDAANTNFYFVQLTDTHLNNHHHDQRTGAAVAQINKLSLDIECVVHTGDIMMDNISNPAAVTNAVAILSALEPPLHYVPGNHDILRPHLEATLPIYTNRFGPLVALQEYHGVCFVFAYTEPLAKSFKVEGYEPLHEIENALKQADGKPVLLFHHSPSHRDFYNNEWHPGWPEPVRRKWIALLNRYNVKGVFTGHFHRDEQHWLGDVPLYVCSPVAFYWGRQASYRIYRYEDGRISYTTQYLDRK